MTGRYFAWFVRNKFPVLFSRKRGRKWFIMDNDPSQRSVAARKAIEKECCELFGKISRLKSNQKHVSYSKKKELERQVIDSQIVRETWQEFKSGVIKTLHNIPVDYIDNIITSMPKRITPGILHAKTIIRSETIFFATARIFLEPGREFNY